MQPVSGEVSRALLEQVLDISPVPLIVVDENGDIVHSNDLVTDLLGWAKEELAGRKLETLLPERFRALHARHFEGYLTAPERRGMNAGLVIWAARQDGTEVPVNIALRPVTLEGSIVIAAAIHDRSRGALDEDTLRMSERRFRLAAAHTSDMVQEVDLQNDRMTYYGDIDNHFGYEAGAFPRTITGFVDLVHPEDRAAVVADVEHALQSEMKTWKWSYRLRAGDGSYRHLRDHGTFVAFADDGRPIKGIGVFEDVTKEVLKEQELQDALADLRAAKVRLADENIYLREELLEGMSFGDIVGDSEAWRHVVAQAQLVAATDSTVLISGETGTGKELLAWAVHAGSARSDRPLISVNCAVLPSTLIESELFGHERGAFSGADRRRRGRFELAEGGTLFLDEIGELALDLQAKLLRVVESGRFERLGSSDTLRCDVRVIAATNRDLRSEVQEGHFRSDLYYRLTVFPIQVPPLRERREDIRLLAMYYLAHQGAKRGKPFDSIPEPAMEAMEAYEWPGNVRELKNLIERAAILSRGTVLEIDTTGLSPGDAVARGGSKLPAAAPEASMGAAATSLESVERAHILTVLESCDWKVKGRGNAAEQLGLKEGTLRARMKRLGITRP